MADITPPLARKKYVCNKDTRKVHSTLAHCSQIDQHGICTEFDDLQDALDAGYTRCSACLPITPQFAGPSPVAVQRVGRMRIELKENDNQRETKVLDGPPVRKG